MDHFPTSEIAVQLLGQCSFRRSVNCIAHTASIPFHFPGINKFVSPIHHVHFVPPFRYCLICSVEFWL